MQGRRITVHPILGKLPPARTFYLLVDGRPVQAREGETVASALVAAGWYVFRHTEKEGEPRGIFCAIGRCTDCVMTVDNVPNVRTCITTVREGMRVESQKGLGQWRRSYADSVLGGRSSGRPVGPGGVAVIGAGPAGLCAAIQLAELGVEVAVFDEKPAAGGQLFKQVHKFLGSGRHLAGVRGFQIGSLLLGRCRELGVPILLNTAVWGVYPDRTVAANAEGRLLECRPKAVILATGAGENSIAFPGWTLPGIMGAGAAQTLVNYYRVRPGERALVVGAGNVGLIVAYQLLQAGIEVAGVAEVTESIGGYFVHAAKVRRLGVPFFLKHTVIRADGEEKVRSCTLAEVDPAGGTVPDSEKRFEVDLLCIAVGLSPAVELGRAMGLAVAYVPELGGYLPLHNAALATSLPGVFAAGDLTGVEEASSAMEEGRLAAVTAAAYAGALPAPRAEALQGELQASLGKLRAGPFGSLIARKKTEIFRKFEESHG